MDEIASGKSGFSVNQTPAADVVELSPAVSEAAPAAAAGRRRSEAEPPAGGLGKSGTAFHRPRLGCRENSIKRVARQDNRADKMRLRAALRPMTPRENFRRCGQRACDASGVGVRISKTDEGRRAGFSGLSTCGSIWLCPVCAAKIAARRASELSAVLSNAQHEGYQLAMVTLTVRHRAEDSLSDVWRAVSTGWNRVTSGKAWLTEKQRWDIAGWAKAVEVTHGQAGWHVHVHAVVAYRGDSAAAKVIGQQMYSRWEKGIQKEGFDALPDYGLDVQESQEGMGNLGKYLSKLGADLDGLAREVTQGAQKKGRSSNRTPFQIGRDATETGEARDVAIWQEWADTAPGHRALTWSKGFRERFGLEDEAADEEIAAEETGTEDDTVLILPNETWRQVRQESWEVLNIAEDLGTSGLKNWLNQRGLPWALPPQPDTAKLNDEWVSRWATLVQG